MPGMRTQVASRDPDIRDADKHTDGMIAQTTWANTHMCQNSVETVCLLEANDGIIIWWIYATEYESV